MYTEDYRKENFPYRNFYLKLILIVVAVALLVCIITAIIKKDKPIESSSGTDSVFSDNLETMKQKALEYYNENNIPKEIDQSSKLTLDKMISEKLLTPIKDKDQKLCNNTKSYVKLTKKENEYQLKVNLVCDDDEDYMILHLNNNDCDTTYLCENKSEDENTENKSEENVEIEEQNQGSNNIKNTKSSTKKTSAKTTSSTKKVRKTQIIQTSKGSITVTDTTSKYQYEYAKTTNAVFSNWGLWSNWQTVNCNTEEITCNNTDINCLKELKRYDRKEKIDTKIKETTTNKGSLKNTNELYAYICSNYDYIKIDNLIYRLSSSDDYKQINNVVANTKKNVGGWTYNGNSSYKTAPTDTYNTHYIYTGTDNNNLYFDKYTYTKSLTLVTSYTCDNNRNYRVPVYTRINETITYNKIENLYGTVCYKSERERTIISKGKTIKKWSKYNDTKLLKQGYYYTGNRKK